MNKIEIIKEIRELTGLSILQIEMVYEGMIQSIQKALARGDVVNIQGLGKFFLHYREANPDWEWGAVKAPQKEKAYPAFRFYPALKKATDAGECQKNPKLFLSKRKKKGGRPWELRKKNSKK